MAIRTIDSFFKEAAALRTHFESRFKNPRETRTDRFVWDYWHVPGQYTNLRTPAYAFFPQKVYRRFHEQLVHWGRANLGCHDVSPPWLSLYVEGCHQELHGDVPHGPWAFVYSLTPWQTRSFLGGETLLLKESLLDYWSRPVPRGLERGDIFDSIEPRFNRLTVFDPRIPHGVSRVSGTHDPLEGRLVVHGWFVEPRPFIVGPLKEEHLQSEIQRLLAYLGENWPDGLFVQGLFSLNFKVLRNGKVSELKVLSNQVRGPSEGGEDLKGLIQWIKKAVSTFDFRAQRAQSSVTLPIVFE